MHGNYLNNLEENKGVKAICNLVTPWKIKKIRTGSKEKGMHCHGYNR
jgi:hypothetical protein